MDVIHALGPVLSISTVFGLFSYHVKSQDEGRIFHKTVVRVVYCILCYVLYVAMVCVSAYVTLPEAFIYILLNNFSDQIFLLVLIRLIAASCVFFIIFIEIPKIIFKARRLWPQVTALALLQSKFCFIRERSITSLKWLHIFLFIFTFSELPFFIRNLFMANSIFELFLSACFFCPQTGILILMTQFTALVNITRFHLVEINRAFIGQNKITKKIISRWKGSVTAGIDVATEINSTYGFLLLCWTITWLVTTEYSVWWLLTHVKATSGDILTNVWAVLYGLAHMTAVLATCDLAKSEAHKTGNHLHKSMIENDELTIQMEVEIFSLELLHRSVEFTALSLFNLNLPLLYSIIGGVTMHLILLMQFEVQTLADEKIANYKDKLKTLDGVLLSESLAITMAEAI